MNEPPEMEPFTAQDARVRFREVLDAVRAGKHVPVTRYGRTEAFVVPPDWYRRAEAALATVEQHE